MNISKHILDVFEDIRGLRRDIHQHPELGTQEYRTQGLIQSYLKAQGIAFETIADTGVMGIIRGKQPGKTVALRADIDALPIQEEVELPFKSCVPGVMHACGHDVHTAILLGAANVLNHMKEEFSGTIKLFFQPAEETIGGAKRMVEQGCMDNPKVDAVIGLHVFPRLETGYVEVKYGKMNASTDSVLVEIFGKSGHGAYPHDGIDALLIAAHVVTGLQTLVSRTISPVESVVLTLGTIEGGVKGNVIADYVKMKGTLRTLDENQRALAKETIERIVKHTSLAFGGRGNVHFEPGYRALINDESVLKVVESIAREHFKVVVADEPSLGAEDFSFFLEKSPGAFYNIGCGNIDLGYVYKGHHPKFAVDEECLKVGIELQVRSALALLENL